MRFPCAITRTLSSSAISPTMFLAEMACLQAVGVSTSRGRPVLRRMSRATMFIAATRQVALSPRSIGPRPQPSSNGQTYYYVATAGNSNDQESADSNEVQAVIP